jgi:hypothetical protein
MTAVSSERTGVASGINNAVARVASLFAVAVLGIVFVWSHDAVLAARLDQLPVPQGAALAHAQAEALGAALRAVLVVSAACALAGAALAAATIQPHK